MTSDADVLEAINVDTYPDGTSVSLKAVFGNTLKYDSEGNVISASAMAQVRGLTCRYGVKWKRRVNHYYGPTLGFDVSGNAWEGSKYFSLKAGSHLNKRRASVDSNKDHH